MNKLEKKNVKNNIIHLEINFGKPLLKSIVYLSKT